MSADSPQVLVEAHELSRRYGDRWALAGVNLRLRPGRSLLVAGHNGAGKTTLLKLLATRLRPTSGSLTIAGRDASTEPLVARRQIAMLGQQNGLYLDLSALENLRVLARLRGGQPDRARCMQLLERVGLQGREHEVVRGFSAGMRKRLAFAAVLLQDAQLVLLDEPYGQLDPAGLVLVDAIVRDLLAQTRAVVVVTHMVQRAASFMHAGLVLDSGRMHWVGSAAELPTAFGEDS